MAYSPSYKLADYTNFSPPHEEYSPFSHHTKNRAQTRPTARESCDLNKQVQNLGQICLFCSVSPLMPNDLAQSPLLLRTCVNMMAPKLTCGSQK